MDNVNDIQIGGDHYNKPYQHWDWVIETNQGYVMGLATKYISRWRDKNGVEDLQKGKHCVQKIMDFMVQRNLDPRIVPEVIRMTDYYVLVNKIPEEDADILYDIITGNMVSAMNRIDTLVIRETNVPEESAPVN